MSQPAYAGPYVLPAPSSTSGPIYASPLQNQAPVIGRDDAFAAKAISPADFSYYSTTDSLFVMEPSKNVRLVNHEYRDRPALSGSQFGDEFIFQVGKEGLTMINKFLLCVQLPEFWTKNTAALSGANQGDMLSKYKDWIALYLLGGYVRGPGAIRVIYSNNTIRTMDADSIHFKKVLYHDRSSAAEQCYEHSSGADAESGYNPGNARGSVNKRQSQTVYYEVDVPFGTSRAFGNMLVASALPDTFEIRFTMPTFSQLIEADATTADDSGWQAYQAAVAAAKGDWNIAAGALGAHFSYDKAASIAGTGLAVPVAPSKVFIRVVGYSLMKTERAALTSAQFSETGSSHKCFDHEMSIDNFASPFTINTQANQVISDDIPIKTIKNPSTYYIHLLRNSLSLNQPVDSFSIILAPGDTLLDAVTALPQGLASCIASNDRFSEVYPIANYGLLDEQKLFTELHSDFYYRTNELAQRFGLKHDIIKYKPTLIVHSLFPLIEEHGLGHLTNVNFIQPAVRLVYTAFPFTADQDPRGLITPIIAQGPKCASVVYNNFRCPISNATWNAIIASNALACGKLVLDNHSCARNIYRSRNGDHWLNYK